MYAFVLCGMEEVGRIQLQPQFDPQQVKAMLTRTVSLGSFT